VWNRRKEILVEDSQKSLPVIYGGNIQNGALNFAQKKYEKRQYALKSKLYPFEIVKAPFIAIIRTLRGQPGDWFFDSILIKGKKLYVPENHVIIIKLPNISLCKIDKLHKQIMDSLKIEYLYAGSPNISVKTVENSYQRAMNAI
jgi:hypothetical protein